MLDDFSSFSKRCPKQKGGFFSCEKVGDEGFAPPQTNLGLSDYART